MNADARLDISERQRKRMCAKIFLKPMKTDARLNISERQRKHICTKIFLKSIKAAIPALVA
jgi:hypothetical protein